MSISQSWRNIQTAYRLIATECACGRRQFPPKEVCVECGRMSDLILVNHDGPERKAVLKAFSHRKEKERDIIPALVEVDGLVFPTRLTDTSLNEVRLGMDLEATFRRTGTTQEGLTTYGTVFRPLVGDRPLPADMKGLPSDRPGIVGYGAHLPRYYLPVESIAKERGVDAEKLKESTGFIEKRVHNFDQDTVTMGVDAARTAVFMSGVRGENVDSVYFSSIRAPDRLRAGATTIAEAIGATPHVKAFDVRASSRGGTSALLDAASVLGSDLMGIERSLVVASDVPWVEEGTQLETGAASGAAALLLGKEDVIASIEGFETFTSDIPDQMWTVKEKYPMLSGRFEGAPAYLRHMVNATKLLLMRMDMGMEDIDHVVLHHPSLSFARKAAKGLGIQLSEHGFRRIIKYIGDPFCSSTLISLTHVLDEAGPDERILMVNYGSGGGADAVVLHTTGLLDERKKHTLPVIEQASVKKEVSYHTYGKRS